MTKQKWLTVAEASLLAREMSLDRTSKTIRSWCRGNHVTAEKQTNRTGDIWVIDRESLITKIKSEIEFRDQERITVPSAAMYEPVQTGSDRFEPVRTSTDKDENGPQQGSSKKIEALKAEISSLKMEVKFNEKLADQFKKEYFKGQEALQAQARYIGHIETNLQLRGQKPDQAFLAAPVPNSGVSERFEVKAEMTSPETITNTQPHPDQSNLYTG